MTDPSSPVPAPEDMPVEILCMWCGKVVFGVADASNSISVTCEECDAERLAASNKRYLEDQRELSRLRSQVERMREDVLTPEEARIVCQYLDGKQERSEANYATARIANVKLRRRLSSGDSEQ